MAQLRYTGDVQTVRHGFPVWEPGETRDVTDAEEVAALAGSPLFEVASSGKASKSTASPVTETAEAAPAAEATSN